MGPEVIDHLLIRRWTYGSERIRATAFRDNAIRGPGVEVQAFVSWPILGLKTVRPKPPISIGFDVSCGKYPTARNSVGSDVRFNAVHNKSSRRFNIIPAILFVLYLVRASFFARCLGGRCTVLYLSECNQASEENR
jgi:hypothetical protein